MMITTDGQQNMRTRQEKGLEQRLTAHMAKDDFMGVKNIRVEHKHT